MPSISSVTDSAPVASAALRVSKLALGSSRPGNLSWRAERARNSAWLVLNHTTGNAPDSLEIRLNPAGLAAGVYRDTVVFSTNNYEAPPVRLPIAFTVHPCRVTTVPLDTIVNAALNAAECGSSHASGMFARVFGFAGVAGDSITIDLVATGFDAQLVLDTVPVAGAVPPLVRATSCRGVVGDPCITYFRLPFTRTYYVEVSGATQAVAGTFVLHVTEPAPPAAPDQPRQLLADSVTAVAVGAVVAAQPVLLSARLQDPDAADSLRLELELRSTLAAFTGTPTHTSAKVANGAVAIIAATVPDDSSYHWRVRSADQTGRRGPWLSFGANAETAADFTSVVPQVPAAPAGLAQLRGSDQAPIVVGGPSSAPAVVFRATVTDPDPGDQLRLQIELRPVGTAFTNLATVQSAPVAGGAIAEAAVSGLIDNTPYHWQARVVDQTTRAGPWISYGGNAEAGADFVIAIPATQLVFSVQPTSTTAGVAMVPAIQVTALTAGGATAVSFADSITFAVGINPGGGTVSGNKVKAVLGVATFANASVNRPGAGYTLTATSPSLPGVVATSTAFTIAAGPPVQLAFTVEPSDVASAAAIAPAVQVAARDAGGNTAVSFNGAVTVAIGTNPGSGVLAGTATATAVAGLATFTNLRIDKAGVGYTLVASATGLSNGTSAAFAVTPAAAASLEFTVEPPGTLDAGLTIAPAMQVRARDAQGNVASGYSGAITLAIAANPGGATLSGTTTRAAAAGVATFPGLSIDRTGVGYTLEASGPGLVPDTSASFTVIAASAARMAFRVQPAAGTAGASLAPAVQVSVQDGLGNLVTTFAGLITVALGANPGGGILGGTLTVPVVGGIATFGDLSINKTGAGYTLTASAAGLSQLTSTAFTIAHAAPSRLAFTSQPTATTAGESIAPTVAVIVRDAFDNTATSFAGTITVAIGTNPGPSTLSGTVQVTAVAGVATFPDLAIDKAGTGYTLTAAGTGLSGATSAPFSVTPGAATQLAFTAQPGAAIAATVLTPAVQVTAQDALGNTVPSFSGSITVAIGTNPGGGTLGGSTVVTAVAGAASFPTLSINKTGTGYTLTATAAGLTTATSAPFTILPGAAIKLAFTVQPSADAAGAIITPAIQVTALDANDNAATGFIGTVTVAIGANPGGGTLSGTLSMTAASGVATFGTLRIDKTGAGYTLTAAASGLTGATSLAFTISPAPATRLVFTFPPLNVAAGSAIAPPVQVTARDSLNNTATGFTGNITIAIAANPAGGTLAGDTTIAAIAGVATFSTLAINRVGTGYTLSASAAGANTAVSPPFDVLAGPATHLTYTVQPTSATAGVAIAPAIRITARDAGGNTATGFTGSVTLTLGANPGGSTLSGEATLTAVAGVVSFGGVRLNRAGTGYTLIASSDGVVSATSAPFDITPGAPSQLVFTVHPTTTAAGSSITPAIDVSARDDEGNTVTTFTGSISLAILSNPGGGTLTGGGAVAAVAGVATFPGVSINKTGIAYRLSAAASGLATGISTLFNITPGAATLLVFTGQPNDATAGVAISPAILVTALDAHGNIATQFTDDVTLAIGSNPSGGTLSGTIVRPVAGGVASFNDVSIDRTGQNYRLSANASGLTGVTSFGFSVSPNVGTRLAFAVQPTDQQAGVAIAPTVRVNAVDAYGNVVPTHVGNITLTLTSPNGATLTGAGPVAIADGFATFPFLSVNQAATGYTLQAASAGLTGAQSTAFSIRPAGASALEFTAQPPASTVAAETMAPAIQARVRDAFGNTVTGFSGNVSVAIAANPGGGALSGTTTVAATAGVALFSTLSIDKSGSGYTLVVTGVGVPTGAVSAPFAIAPGTATQLAFTVQPVTTVAATPITPAVQVIARDAQGNTATSFNGDITVAIGTNAGGGTLSGTLQVGAIGGSATFAGLSIDKAGGAYTLTATSGALTATTSAPFGIVAGPATQLVFTLQPHDATAGVANAPPVQVTALDAQGNTATGFSGNVTIGIGTNPGGSALTGNTATAVGGVATFGNLRLNRTGTGYTLTAAAAGLTGATSATFNITPGTASVLVFTIQPSTTTAGVAMSPPVQVTARDDQGNTATGFTGAIGVALLNNPGGSTLTGGGAVAAVAGVVNFANLRLNRSGAGYTLTAAATGLPGATSAAFSITPAPAVALVFSVPPAAATAGVAIAPPVLVTARDSLNNTATSFTGTITLTIGSNPSSGVLSGPSALAATGGVATFPGLNINAAGTGYTLTAAATGLTGATSPPFNITAGGPATLVFTVPPSSATAGVAISPAVVVTARDNQGNTATAFTGPVTIAIGTNPGASTLLGTATLPAVAGVATFTNLRLNRTGTSYTLTATALGPPVATSSAFNISPAPASALEFTVPPSNSIAGVAMAPAVQVAARDSMGNTVTSFAGGISLSILNNPGLGVLTGGGAVTPVAGVATFPGVSINKTGVGYVLAAASTGLTNGTSGPFTITPGTATQLAITIQPVTTVAATPIAPAVQVTARDAHGNTATSFTGNVTVAIGTNPGGSALSGTTTVAAVAGVASFSTLSLNKSGVGYTLDATAGGLTGTTSAAFGIVSGPATLLVFTVQPSNATAGVANAPAIQVTARDAQGNTATGFTDNVTLAIGTNPGASVLGGAPTVAALAGNATFSNIRLNRTGSGYTLTATALGLTSATSAAFNIAAAPASALVFTVQPTSATAGVAIAPAIQVAARDSMGNPVPAFAGNVSLSILSNPGGGLLTGGGAVTPVGGVATFPSVSINKSGTGYVLSAAATGLTSATSGSFNIAPGAPAVLAFTIQPNDATAGVAFSPAVQVTALDVHGNVTPQFTGDVTMTIGTNPSGGTLSGTPVRAAVAGVATFDNLSINFVGQNYRLTANAAGLTGVSSFAFSINVGAPSHLVFAVQPTDQQVDAVIAPTVRVNVVDSQGNIAWPYVGTITLTLTNPNGATLTGGGPLTVVDGFVTFPGLRVNQAGGYALTATAASVTGATSNPFTITPAGASVR